MKQLFGKIQFKEHNWHIGQELKVFSFLLAYSVTTQRFGAFCVSEIIGTENIITSKNSGLNDNRLFQDTEMQ